MNPYRSIDGLLAEAKTKWEAMIKTIKIITELMEDTISRVFLFIWLNKSVIYINLTHCYHKPQINIGQVIHDRV